MAFERSEMIRHKANGHMLANMLQGRCMPLLPQKPEKMRRKIKAHVINQVHGFFYLVLRRPTPHLMFSASTFIVQHPVKYMAMKHYINYMVFNYVGFWSD